MSVSNVTREYRLSQWFPIVKACRESGLSVKEWCKQNNIIDHQFYYWQRKLREVASEAISVDEGNPSRFVQLPTTTCTSTVSSEPFKTSMIVRVGNASIELSDHVQPEMLAQVLKVLSDV